MKPIIALFLCTVAINASAAGTEKVILDVKGMHCGTCPLTVKVVLKKQQGVEDVKMDAEKHTALVSFDPKVMTPEKLAQVVTEAGYPATPRK